MSLPRGLLESSEMENADLLILKNELTTDPLNLGLTTAVEDDEANANLLNEVRPTILVYRASVPANDLVIPVDEIGALSEAQRFSWQIETQDGSVNPAAYEANFFAMFGAGTQARTIWNANVKEPASRGRQLFERYINITPSDVANARNAT
jgi:hypothetical protein